MDLDQLTQEMAAQDATNGWDAVCAMNKDQVAAIWYQDFLNRGPASSAWHLRFLVPSGADSSVFVLDANVGPPDVSFPPGLEPQQCQVTMFFNGGLLLQIDPDRQVIERAVVIHPTRSWMQGPLELDQVAGDLNQVGRAEADLSKAAYRPTLEGVDPASELNTQIGNAVQTYFLNNPTKYPIGVVALSDVPAALQPLHFRIVVQQKPANADDGCVVLLIQTKEGRGSPGQLAPLPTYPIPSDRSAALILSNQVLFGKLMPEQLVKAFKAANLPVQFTAQQSGATWQAVATSGGTLNVGVLRGPGEHDPYTSGASGTDEASVVVNLNGLTVSPSGNALTVRWSYKWTQPWSYWQYNPPSREQMHPGWQRYSYTPYQLQATYSQTGSPTVASDTGTVSFPATAQMSLTPVDPPSTFEKIFSPATTDKVAADFQGTLQEAVGNVLAGIPLPDVKTFALANLLFPADHALALRQASLPGDLLCVGEMVQTLTVTSVAKTTAAGFITVQPGGTLDFSASLKGVQTRNVTWQANAGTIDGNGHYQAPATVSGPVMDVVRASNRDDLKVGGAAGVLVYSPPPATALSTDPEEVTLTAGSKVTFTVRDGSTPITADQPTLSPQLGSISQDFEGNWQYQAPGTIQQPTPVTVSFSSSDRSKHGQATVHLLPAASVTVHPGPNDPPVEVAPGGMLKLTASAPDIDSFHWILYPSGKGTIVGSGSQATYTAPASIATADFVNVVTYGLGKAAGVAFTRVRLVPGAARGEP
jgi:hypothetical protein